MILGKAGGMRCSFGRFQQNCALADSNKIVDLALRIDYNTYVTQR